MKNFGTIGLSVILLALVRITPAFPQAAEETAYQQWVDYRNGAVSLAFNHIPVEVALYALRARTGLEIVIPSADDRKLLNLQLRQVPLEPAVRSLLSSIGVTSFALWYDEKGHPSRAVALAIKPEDHGGGDLNAPSRGIEPLPQPLTAAERDKLQNELERWSDLKQEERGRIEDRLKTLPPSEERELLLREYARQILGIKNNS